MSFCVLTNVCMFCLAWWLYIQSGTVCFTSICEICVTIVTSLSSGSFSKIRPEAEPQQKSNENDGKAKQRMVQRMCFTYLNILLSPHLSLNQLGIHPAQQRMCTAHIECHQANCTSPQQNHEHCNINQKTNVRYVKHGMRRWQLTSPPPAHTYQKGNTGACSMYQVMWSPLSSSLLMCVIRLSRLLTRI